MQTGGFPMPVGHVDALLSLASGLGIGIIYFGGLWWTVRRLPSTRRPGLLTFVSLGARIFVGLLGFYVIMQGRWERLLLCLLGFTLIRILMVRRLQPTATNG